MRTASTAPIATPATVDIPRPARLRCPAGGLVVGDRFYRGGVFLPDSARPALVVAASKASSASIGNPVIVGINGFAYGIESVPIAASVGTVAYLVIPREKPTVLPPFAARTLPSPDVPTPRKSVKILQFSATSRRFDPSPDEYAEAAALLGWR